MAALRTAGKNLCSPRAHAGNPLRNSVEQSPALGIDASTARPPLPFTPGGTSPVPSATRCRSAASGSSPRDVPPLPRQPLSAVPAGSMSFNAGGTNCQMSSTGSLGAHSYQSNASASSIGSAGTGSGVSEVGGDSRSTSRPNSTGVGRIEKEFSPRHDMESMEEVQADNLKLQREIEQLRDQVLAMASNSNRCINATSSTGKSVVGGGFRGGAIRSGEKRGREVTEKEVETLRSVVQQKTAKIAQMEEIFKSMQADGLSQEQSLFELQKNLANACDLLMTTDSERETLERSVEELNKQLANERDRIDEVQQKAADVSAGNEELSNMLLMLKAQLQAKSSAWSNAEGRAADLQSEFSSAVARIGDLKIEMETEQVKAQLYLRECLTDKREIHKRYLIAVSLRHSVLQLCWEAWIHRFANRQLPEELETLRQEASENKELMAMRSVLHERVIYVEREAQEKVQLEAERFKCYTDEAHSEFDDLKTELREMELQEAQERKVADRVLCEKGAFQSSEDKLRGNVEYLRQQLREAKIANDAQTHLASEVREACVAEEVGLKARVAELESKLRYSESADEAQGQVSVLAEGRERSGMDKERENRIQREETLLRELRRAEKDRDEARAQLQRLEQQRVVPKRPIGSPNATRSPAARACNSPQSHSPSPHKKSNIEKEITSASVDKASISRVTVFEQELAKECESVRELRQQVEESRAHFNEQKQQMQLETESRTEALQASTRDAKASTSELEQARDVADKLREDLVAASIETEKAKGLQTELSEVRSDLCLQRVDVRRLRQAREELEASLKNAREEAFASVNEARKWKDAVTEAVEQAQNSVRILVTAPKVCINVGNTELSTQVGAIPKDIEKLRSVVNDRVLPSFQRILAVAEEDSENEVRNTVLKMVEELAGKVQQQLYRLLPQAEGTASWDGFGSKASGVK